LKELGAVNDLLQVSGETSVRAKKLPESAYKEISEVIARHGGEVLSIDNPRTTLEELFLNIVRESEERPGRRAVAAVAPANEEGADSGR
jgi:ABC-2 type transport system ATP-binding protein